MSILKICQYTIAENNFFENSIIKHQSTKYDKKLIYNIPLPRSLLYKCTVA
jgi:hypothetical protein